MKEMMANFLTKPFDVGCSCRLLFLEIRAASGELCLIFEMFKVVQTQLGVIREDLYSSRSLSSLDVRRLHLLYWVFSVLTVLDIIF